MTTLKFIIGPFISGIIFAMGLGISGMTESKNIIAFLDIFGHWQGELILVMGGALIVYGLLFRLITKKSQPLFEKSFSLPTQKKVDRPLIVGAILFGFGWGITGLCPGPGLVAVVSGKTYALIFAFTMVLGMWLGRSKKVSSLVGKT